MDGCGKGWVDVLVFCLSWSIAGEDGFVGDNGSFVRIYRIGLVHDQALAGAPVC